MVGGGAPTALLVPFLKVRQLHSQYRGLNGVHAAVPSKLIMIVTARGTVIAQTTHVLGEFRVARRHQSGIAVGAKILGWIETESSRRAQGPDAPIAPSCANSLCRIF